MTQVGDALHWAYRAWRRRSRTATQDADGELTLMMAGQPVYRLRPSRQRIFALAELPGFRVEFRCGSDGAVEEAIFHQPNGTFVARRASG